MNDMVTDSRNAATSMIFLEMLLVYSPITDVLFTIIITARNTSGTTMALTPINNRSLNKAGNVHKGASTAGIIIHIVTVLLKRLFSFEWCQSKPNMSRIK